jgi:hypothetical protein
MAEMISRSSTLKDSSLDESQQWLNPPGFCFALLPTENSEEPVSSFSLGEMDWEVLGVKYSG